MTMSKSVSIDTKTAESIFEEIEVIQKRLEALRKKIATFLPHKYGSDEWWEKEEKEADEDIKAGRVVKFESMKDAIKWLNS